MIKKHFRKKARKHQMNGVPGSRNVSAEFTKDFENKGGRGNHFIPCQRHLYDMIQADTQQSGSTW